MRTSSNLTTPITPDRSMTSFRQHLLSFASLVWVCLNLLTGLCVLVPVALLNLLLPIAAVQTRCARIVEHLYRWAVRVDSFWLKHIVGISIEVRGEMTRHPAPVVISNHACAFDIAVLQEIIAADGPMLKFLIKKELVWLPIIGWVCLLLDFPRLNRNRQKRQQDYQTVRNASRKHGIERSTHSGALLIFPEGTRFTPAKREAQDHAQQSPYQHLLKPKSGGLNIIQQYARKDTPLIDITIDYGQAQNPKARIDLWRCLHGSPRSIVVHIAEYRLADIDDIEQWLNRRWRQKDSLLLTR